MSGIRSLLLSTLALMCFAVAPGLLDAQTGSISGVVTNDAGEEVKYMTNEMFLTDSKLYAEPVRITGTLRFSPDTPIMEYSCSEQIYDQHLQDRGLVPPNFSEL